MAIDANNLVLHIKRVVYSSIRLSYRSARDYPIVLGTGILLLFLHRLCPSLFGFLLSSSPVFLLTALLLGALLSYGEPNVPEIEEEISKTRQISSLKSKISITDCSMEEVENVTVQNHTEKRTKNEEVYIERAVDEKLHDAYCKEENASSTTDDTLSCAKSSVHVENNVIVEREAHVQETTEKVELQEVESSNAESQNDKLHNQYQFGELMSSCWQPVMGHDPCSDSESDLTESSSPDASMTDIIPMLEELHPLIDLETGQPASTSKDNLNASSTDADEDDDDEDDDDNSNVEDEDHDTEEEEGANGKKENGNGVAITWTEDNQKNVMDLNFSELEKNSNLESLMERRRAKNIVKFELDMNLMDMRAADAMRKMEEASRFRVHVPSISTPRRNPFDLSNDSEETIELPQIPDSAPSVLLPSRNLFDLPFDQIVDSSTRPRETWSPHSYLSAPQRDTFFRRHGNFDGALRQNKHSPRFNPCFVPGMESYGGRSTSLQYHNGIKLEKGEISGTDAHDSQSDSDTEQPQNNVKLFGSLEAHISEEIKILSAAISDAGILEVNYGTDEGTQLADSSYEKSPLSIQKSLSGTSEVDDDLINAGRGDLKGIVSQASNREVDISEAVSSSVFVKAETPEMEQPTSEQSALYLPPEETNSELHVVEASSIEEINSLFKHIKEQVLMQSVSESSLGKPSTVKLEIESSELLLSDSGLHVIEASSVEEMSVLFKQFHAESNTYSGSTSGELPVMKHDLEQVVDNSKMHVVEASSAEEIELQLHEEAQVHSLSTFTPGDTSKVNLEVTPSEQLSTDTEQGLHNSELHVLEASSVDEINSLFKKIQEECAFGEASTVSTNSDQVSHSSQLHVVEARSVEEISSLFKQLHEESQLLEVSESTSGEASSVNIEVKPEVPSAKGVEDSSELHVLEASSVEEINSLFKQLSEEVQTHPQSTFGSSPMVNVEVRQSEQSSEMHVVEASSVEELNSQLKQLREEAQMHAASELTCKNESIEDRSSEPLSAENEKTPHSSDFHFVEARSIEDINSLFKQHDEAQKHAVLEPPAPRIEITPLSVDSEQPVYSSELHVLEASSVEVINSVFKQLHDEVEIHNVSDPTVKLEDSSSEPISMDIKESLRSYCELPVVEASLVEEINALFKQLHEEAQMHAILDSTLDEPTAVKLEARPNELLTTDAELPVLEASSVEEMNSVFKQLEEEAQTLHSSESTFGESVVVELENQSHESHTIQLGQELEVTHSDMLVLEAKSIENIDSAFKQLSNGHDKMKISQDNNSELQVVEAKSLDDIHLALKQLSGDTSDNASKVIELKEEPERVEPSVLEVQSAREMELASQESVVSDGVSNSIHARDTEEKPVL